MLIPKTNPLQFTNETTKSLVSEKKYNAEQLKKTCQEFEALFTEQMLKTMWKTVPSGGLLPKSQAQKIWEDMYVEQIAKEISGGKGLGIADSLFRQLSAQLTYKDSSK